MRKSFVLFGIILSVLVFANCNSSKKLAKVVPKATYTADLSVVIMNNCVPCHIPAKGGRKKAYDNYANVKTDIDEMIRRIELNPADKGFMPFRGATKLNDSTIAVFKKWKADGLLEN
jgi:hypothetical protein